MYLRKISNRVKKSPLIAVLFIASIQQPQVSLACSEADVEITQLIQRLNNREEQVRLHAAEALKRSNNECVIKHLIRALNLGGYNQRFEAARLLGEIGNEMAIIPLINALDDRSGGVRQNVRYALIKIGGSSVVGHLLNKLKYIEMTPEKILVLQTIKKIVEKTGPEPLVAGLGNEHLIVRREAAILLGELGDDRAIEVLGAYPKELDEDSQYRVINALEKVYEDQPLHFWILRLKTGDYADKCEAAIELGKIGDERAVIPLIEATKDGNSKKYRKILFDTLKRITNDRLYDIIEKVINDGDRLLLNSFVPMLGESGDEKTIDLLKTLFRYKNGDTRRYAVRAVTNIGGDKAVECLTSALNENNSDVRRYAAQGLATLKRKRTIRP